MDSSEESDITEDSLAATPPELVNAAQILQENIFPTKSKEKYIATYDNFMKWRADKNATSLSETILLAYFGELADKYKASSIWAIYSMLKSTLKVKNNINIDQYLQLKAFLKRKNEGYVPKKSKILTGVNIENFINEAPDEIYLATKVALIFGITGALRGQELCDVTVDDVSNQGEIILVKVPNTKNRVPRSFVISGNYCTMVKKYQSLRSPKSTSNRFFQQFRNGKCIAQVIGKNKLGSMPKEIACYLNLPDASLYTGHSFRRTSATLLADSGVDIGTLKRHGGWKSSTVAEGYIDDSITNKIDVCNKIKQSIQLSHNIMPEPVEPIASTSSAPIQNMPAQVKQGLKISNRQNIITPIATCCKDLDQVPPLDQDIEHQATQNINNSIQNVKYPEQNMTFNFSNNSSCTITLNFNK